MTTIAPTWKRIRTALLALVVLASSAGVALAQQFEKVENLPRQEIPAGRFVGIAYGIIWLAILSYVVLVARLRALIRRGAGERPAVLEAGDLGFDPGSKRTWRAGAEVDLTAREMALLEFLLRRKGEVVSKTEILHQVWDYDFEGDPNIVEVYVRHLRNKLDRPFGRNALETVRGSGYRLAADGG